MLKYGVSHMFRITAVNGMGNSVPSEVVTMRVVNPPPRPSITSVSFHCFVYILVLLFYDMLAADPCSSR